MSEVDDLLNFILSILNIKTLDEEPTENQKQLAFIYKFIIDKYAFLTIEEVKEAFRMYVANQFDIKVFRMLDCVVVGEVLTCYIEFRNSTLVNYKPTDNTVKLESVSKETIESTNKAAVNRVFNEFKETKHIPEGLTYIYDILTEYGLIKVYTDETPKLKKYYDEKMSQAVAELKREKQQEINNYKLGIDNVLVKSLKNALEKIEKGTSTAIILRTKKLILKEFFIHKMLGGETKIF